MGNLFQKIVSMVFIYYIEFVYATSKIIIEGCYDSLKDVNGERFIISFWHGENYCFYPLLRGKNLFVITTKDKRGDYIASICKHFGYTPVRMPDNSEGENSFFKISSIINSGENSNLVITLDGPLGPYHQVKKLPLMMALFSKRRIIAVSIDVKRKIRLKKRWDKYIVPLPFNIIKIYVHEPLKIEKSDLKGKFKQKMEFIKNIMENKFIRNKSNET